MVEYCGTECQTAAWRGGHKGECKQMAAAAKEGKTGQGSTPANGSSDAKDNGAGVPGAGEKKPAKWKRKLDKKKQQLNKAMAESVLKTVVSMANGANGTGGPRGPKPPEDDDSEKPFSFASSSHSA